MTGHAKASGRRETRKSLKKRDHSEDLSVDGKVTLKLILRKEV
jgi:hypothetical protein